MIELDEYELKILRENFDDEIISKIDKENVSKISEYLNNNKVYYYKDLFLNALDLFLLPYDIFVERFEKLKNKLGNNYYELLENDISLIELMYE